MTTGTALADSVARTVAKMDWLTDADTAAVDLAMRYAHQIDAALARGGQDATKGMHLGPHLLRVLGELGGTPTARKTMETPDDEVGGALAKLRAERKRRA